MVKGAGAEKGFLGVLGIRVRCNAQPRVRAPEARPDGALWARSLALHAWVSLEAPCTQLASSRGRWRRRSKRVPSRSPPPPPTFFPPGEMRAHCPGRRAPGIPESPPASRRDPRDLPGSARAKPAVFLRRGFPGTHPSPPLKAGGQLGMPGGRPAGRPAKIPRSSPGHRELRPTSQARGKPCRPGLGGHAGKKLPTPAPHLYPHPPPQAPGTPPQVEFLLRITSILINLFKTPLSRRLQKINQT